MLMLQIPSKKSTTSSTQSRSEKNKLYAHSPWRSLRNWWRKIPVTELSGYEEVTRRPELFSTAQLEKHARFLASRHDFESVRGSDLMLQQLVKNEEIISYCHKIIAASVQQGHRISPAAEWLLDNYHLIQEQIELTQSHLSPGYSRGLPRLTAGPRRGFPRIYDIVMEVVRHTDAQVSQENLSCFIHAYQQVRSLTLGELWAAPIMLRLSLIENLVLVAQRIAWRRNQSDTALHWAERFLQVVETNPKMFVTTLGDFVRVAPPLTAPLIAELVTSIDGVNPVLGLALNWLEQELSERGQTIEGVLQSENQAQAADLVTTSNSISGLRAMHAIDWAGFVEAVSTVEAILRRDPAGVYPQMDFRSRNRYRTQVERVARYSRKSEREVSEAVVELAAERRKINADRYQSHVGYFLIDIGYRELEDKIGYRLPVYRRPGRWLRCHPLTLYLGCITILTLVMASVSVASLKGAATGWFTVLWTVAAIWVVSKPAIGLTNWVITLVVPPHFLPSLDFAEGIPPDHRTIVTVPTLVGSTVEGSQLLSDLEIRYLANTSSNLWFALLTDLPDADVEQLSTDSRIIATVAKGIRRLNERYAKEGETIFFLLNRPRSWNPGERKWMGRERKRGKLEDFNRLVVEGCDEAFSLIESDPSYCVLAVVFSQKAPNCFN